PESRRSRSSSRRCTVTGLRSSPRRRPEASSRQRWLPLDTSRDLWKIAVCQVPASPRVCGDMAFLGPFFARRPASEDELGEHLERLRLRRADDERRHRRLPPRLEPLPDARLRADERDRVDELVRNRRDRLALPAAEVELLDLRRLGLPAVPADER